MRTHDNEHHLDVDDLYLGTPEYALAPEDDASYSWDASDVQFQAIVDAGMGVYLRIGGSALDGTSFLPRNPGTAGWETRWDNFQRVCKFIVRHYVEHSGAFDPDEGYAGPIVAVEIWNEPNNEKFWDLGEEYFAEFYINLLEALNSEFPGLPVGGPGVGWGAFREDADGDGKPDWVAGFIGRVVDCSGDAMAKYRSPSFFSWHIYSPDPDDYVQAAQAYADLITGFWRTLDVNCGTTLQGMESHVSEWNTKAAPDENRGTGVGAAQLTGGWIGLAGEGVNRATFHRGMDETDTSGDMGGYGLLTYSDDEASSRQTKPIGEAFDLWSDFVAADGDRLRLTPSASPAGFYSLARAASTGDVVILLTNFGENEVKYQIQLPETETTLPASSLSIDEIDASGARRSYTPSSVPVVLPSNTVHLVRAGS